MIIAIRHHCFVYIKTEMRRYVLSYYSYLLFEGVTGHRKNPVMIFSIMRPVLFFMKMEVRKDILSNLSKCLNAKVVSLLIFKYM